MPKSRSGWAQNDNEHSGRAESPGSSAGVTTIHRLDSPTAGDEVDHRYYKGNDQQSMDQAAAHVETPSEEPHNQQNREYRPKHMFTWATGEWLSPLEGSAIWGVVPDRHKKRPRR